MRSEFTQRVAEMMTLLVMKWIIPENSLRLAPVSKFTCIFFFSIGNMINQWILLPYGFRCHRHGLGQMDIIEKTRGTSHMRIASKLTDWSVVADCNECYVDICCYDHCLHPFQIVRHLLSHGFNGFNTCLKPTQRK